MLISTVYLVGENGNKTNVIQAQREQDQLFLPLSVTNSQKNNPEHLKS